MGIEPTEAKLSYKKIIAKVKNKSGCCIKHGERTCLPCEFELRRMLSEKDMEVFMTSVDGLQKTFEAGLYGEFKRGAKEEREKLIQWITWELKLSKHPETQLKFKLLLKKLKKGEI